MSDGADDAGFQGFIDVVGADDTDLLLRGMDATAQWPAVRELHAWSHQLLVGAGSLLDVGCGQGYALMRLAQDSGSGRFVGVDVSDAMLDQARERAAEAGLDVTFQEASALELPFADDEFAATRCERVLQWLDDPQGAVDELVRVTAPGGRVLVLDTDWRTFGTTVDPDLETAVLGGGQWIWPSRHAGGHLRHYLTTAGLAEVEAKPVVHHATAWAGDGSDGLFPDDVLVESRVAAGVDRDDAQRFIDELRSQAEAGTLSLVLTMWGATGVVAG